MRLTPHQNPLVVRGLSTSSRAEHDTEHRPKGLTRRTRRTRRTWIAALAAGTVAAGLLSGPAAQALPAPDPSVTTMSIKAPPGSSGPRVLVFYGSAAAGEESPVVNAGIEAIEAIGRSGPAAERFSVEATDDSAVFTDEERLGGFNAVVFLTGGGDVLEPEQEAGLEAFASGRSEPEAQLIDRL